MNSKNSDNLNARVALGQTKWIYGNARHTLVLICIIAPIISWLMYGIIPVTRLIIWPLLVICSYVVIFLIDTRATTEGLNLQNHLKWRKIRVMYGLMAVATIGSVALFLYPPGNISYQAALLFFVSAICTAALVDFSVIRYYLISIILMVMGPLTVRLLIEGGDSLILGVLGVLWILAIVQLSDRINRHILHQIQLQEELNDQIELVQKQADTDELTGIANRNAFTKEFDRALARTYRNNKKMALLFIDLDNFKDINDDQGHIAGDSVLKHIAQRFKSDIRQVDMVARLGGDEFIIMMEIIDSAETAIQVGNKLINNIHQSKFPPLVQAKSFGISIGVSLYPDDGTNFDELLNTADARMYQAKREGKDRLIA